MIILFTVLLSRRSSRWIKKFRSLPSALSSPRHKSIFYLLSNSTSGYRFLFQTNNAPWIIGVRKVMNIINNQLICFYFIVSLGFLRMQNNMAFIHILSFPLYFFKNFFFNFFWGGGSWQRLKLTDLNPQTDR